MSKVVDLNGKTFGFLKVIGREESGPDGKSRWRCRCKCGTEKIVYGANLTRLQTVSCGCKKQNYLSGQHIGNLQVLERSDHYATRGKRRVRLWKCRCDCGAITYKATDTLTNDDVNMCQKCAEKYCADKARENAGFVEKTQLSKIRQSSSVSTNASGVKGVYLNKKTGNYTARIKFQGVTHYLGTFGTLKEAVNARKEAEEKYFGPVLERHGYREAANA